MPSSIDDFQLLRVLGNGSFGAVLEAVGKSDKLASRHVAIKMMAKNRLSSEGLKRRVVNEVSIHLRLQHPAVLKLYDCFEDKQNVYLVMELCGGGALDALLFRQDGKRHKLTESQARRIMQQLVGGLMYLHTHGVLHRDLKPSNILLTKEGQVKLGDFGLSVLLEMDRLNEERTLCGTPNYMAPEILARQPYGFASDIWSLGCVFVSMLTGRPPFQGRTPEETLDNIRNGYIPWLSQMSPVAQDLAKQILKRDPFQRLSLTHILLHPFFTEQLAAQWTPLPDEPVAATRATASAAAAAAPTTAESVTSVTPTPTIANEHVNIPLVPINTERLRPMKQQTQHGNIELLEDGRVKLAVRGESRIMLISGDGNTIELIEEGSRPAVVAKYKLDDLPEQYHRKYAYASRFVELVRSRTPKITYFSSEAQCSLMENGPNADFEVKFYDGWKIQYSARRKELEVTEPVPTHASSSSSPSSGRQRSTPITHRFDPERDLLDLAPPIATRFQHARDILARCLDAERQSSSYPVVIRRRANSNTAPILSSRSPSVTFYDNDLYQNNVETKPAKATPASTSNTTQNTRIEKPYLYTAFLSHVGWLVRFVHGDLALFVDGTQLRTKHTQQMIYWRESSHATEECYSLDEALPVVVAEKLSLIPLLQSLPV